MKKIQVITAALALGAASFVFADDMNTTTTTTANETTMECPTQMSKADCEAAGGTVKGNMADGSDAKQTCTMTQAACDAASKNSMDDSSKPADSGSSTDMNSSTTTPAQ